MPVRPARLADLNTVHALECAVFGDPVYPAFFFRQAHDLWPSLLLVAEDDTTGRVVGYILGAPGEEDGAAWILSLAVEAGHRGRGWAQRLLCRLMEALAARGRRRARLTVHPDNAALRLYQRHGFRTLAEEPHYFHENDPRLVLERILQPDD
ncbi:GNAT family N-acetyltransferase [Gulbenkiania mobilis]|uniref:Ribosomal protein S18 acetylase RimI-like enzyme n=1 Tax=Gulbenkiania mobilis TaxID=397457 RepID=A0ABY2CUN8_GULMO|nr:ribosomal protein S18 acetylase RimI-like enzyme [Gulbenkiania mobilis]